jgi:hypothetical protein
VIPADDLVLAGSGDADTPHPELIDAKARATIRYADPSAWIIAVAVARATAGAATWLGPDRDDVGMVMVSDQGPRDTMAQVEEAARAGFSSPLRYAAAVPGSLVGVSCIAFRFRGPTLNLTMPPHLAIPTMLLIARGWLTRGIARAIVLATFTAGPGAAGTARAILVGHRTVFGGGDDLTAATVRWLGQIDNESIGV